MKLDAIRDGIYHAIFRSQYEMASAMVRFQEFHENPRLRGTIFTLDDVLNHVAKPDGTIDYFREYEGFNVPSTVFEPFARGDFNPLRERELRLLSELEDIERPFYLIATTGTDEETLRHEVGHGLWHTDLRYQLAVKSVLRGLRKKQRRVLEGFLKDKGTYHEAVWEDEMHAYLLDGGDDLKEKGINLKPYREAQRELQVIFARFMRKGK